MTMSTGYTVAEQAREIAKAGMQRRAYQKGFEFERLIELILNQQPRAFLEIGTAEGGAYYSFCHAAHPEATCVSIDWAPELGEPYVDSVVLESFALPTQRPVIIRGDSRLEETRDAARAAAPGGYDFLFIDADHTLPAVTRDYELYAPLVKPGGLIGFHDVMEPKIRKIGHQRITQVDLFWNSLDKPRGSYYEFIDYSDTTWGGIGVLKVPPLVEAGEIRQTADGGVIIGVPEATLDITTPLPG